MKCLTPLTLLFVLCSSLIACQPNSNEKKIGIIVPIEHKAMNEIVAGFKESIASHYSEPVSFKVANAQGDINLLRAIISQMKDEHYAVVAPIGTDTTQMTVSVIKQHPIVSLAASLTDKERKALPACNVAVVHDEISSERLVSFIHTVYPAITQITLVHSTSDKIFPEVKAAVSAGKTFGIHIKPMMVASLNELYSTANSLPSDTQAVFVLKDSLIVSGISTLALAAEKRHIPLITSDQGSVQDGAGLALGVHEKEIGLEGGILAADVLSGKKPCDLPVVEMSHLTIFVNRSALAKEQMTLPPIEAAAQKLHYPLDYVDDTKPKVTP